MARGADGCVIPGQVGGCVAVQLEHGAGVIPGQAGVRSRVREGESRRAACGRCGAGRAGRVRAGGWAPCGWGRWRGPLARALERGVVAATNTHARTHERLQPHPVVSLSLSVGQVSGDWECPKCETSNMRLVRGRFIVLLCTLRCVRSRILQARACARPKARGKGGGRGGGTRHLKSRAVPVPPCRAAPFRLLAPACLEEGLPIFRPPPGRAPPPGAGPGCSPSPRPRSINVLPLVAAIASFKVAEREESMLRRLRCHVRG
jgi:hypothetical protein